MWNPNYTTSATLILILLLVESAYSGDGEGLKTSRLPDSHGAPVVNNGDRQNAMADGQLPQTSQSGNSGSSGNQRNSTIARLKKAELQSLGVQLAGMGAFQALDIWKSGYRPFSDARDNLRRAWTTAPEWDDDSYFFNYLGHPYTGALSYNLMRSQKASPWVSWLFSCSQSLLWEYTLEAMEEHPSIQDLAYTSTLGSLIGEGFHQLTIKMKKNGFSLREKIIVLLINPGYVLNNGFR
jgi:hypothetical protein